MSAITAPADADFNAAYHLTKKHGRLFIVTVNEKGKPAYVVYRRGPTDHDRPVRIARRSNTRALLKLIKTLTGE